MTVRLRVLLVNYEFPPIGAGAGNATANIARCLAASGVEVIVLTSRFHNLPHYEVRDRYLIVRTPGLRRRADQCTPVEMLSFIAGALVPAAMVARRWRIDVACAFFGMPSGPITLFLRKLLGIPYLVSLRGGDVPGFLGNDLRIWHRLAGPAIDAVWRSSAGLIANSPGLAALARQHAPSAPIALIPNGVNVDEFSPPTRTRPANPPRLLFVGRLARQKGVRYLLEALRSAGSRPLLRIVGDGPDRPELERFIAEHGLSDRVEIVGWLAREQLPAQYDWGDIFVLPSLDEGMPNVVLEAQAAGMPVIATDVPGSRDLVTTGVDGLLVPPEDARSLAFAIETLCHEPARLRAYGQQSREAALARRWEQIADRYRTALLGACGRGSTAAASNDAVMSW